MQCGEGRFLCAPRQDARRLGLYHPEGNGDRAYRAAPGSPLDGEMDMIGRTNPFLAMMALLLGCGVAGTAQAIVIVPPATFSASLEVFGYGGGGSTPGSYSIDNYCNDYGCGSASAVMTSNVAGEQTTSGSALSSRDVGANSSIDIVYYFYFPGPAGGTVDYHWSASGSTSLFGGGAAFANLYKNSVPQGHACSSSVVGNCGAVGNSFAFNIELSAPANTLQEAKSSCRGARRDSAADPTRRRSIP